MGIHGGGSIDLLVRRLGFSWLIVFLKHISLDHQLKVSCGAKNNIIGLNKKKQSEIVLSKEYSLHLVDKSGEIIL